MKFYELKQRQSLPLKQKINLSIKKIREFYERNEGDVYIAFSGGKDSTALLHLIRSIYPNVKATFVNTGLEYPEIVNFVKSTENIDIIKPTKTFKEVIDRWGYPIISKTVSMAISRYRNTKSLDQKEYRLNGKIVNGKKLNAGTIPKKWHFLVDAPFKISEHCCNVMKKQPFLNYEKKTKLKPFIGLMASDSNNRQNYYLKYGCNIYSSDHIKSMPLSFWTEKDIWDYIKLFNITYCSIYDIKGIDRTGCVFCMFGIAKEKEDRFESLKVTHPKLYNYCMNKLGLKKVLNYIKNNKK